LRERGGERERERKRFFFFSHLALYNRSLWCNTGNVIVDSSRGHRLGLHVGVEVFVVKLFRKLEQELLNFNCFLGQ
jgi:hypothetical protein